MSDISSAQSGLIDELQANRVDGGKPFGGGDKSILAEKPDGTLVEITFDGEVKAAPADAKPDAETAGVPQVEEETTSREVLPDTAGSAITVPARLGFEQQQVVAIKNTVAAECSPAELVMFLEIAARYELDPFAKQIYAAKMKGRVVIIVSRDGLLAHAHKQATFERMDGDVVHENDEFTSVFENGERKIKHAFSTKVDPSASGAEGEPLGRGKIIGAWARVVREGHGETFFFAPMSEYVQDREGPWKKTPSAMILKCAETYALRKAFSISGVVGEDEVEKERKTLTDVATGKTTEQPFTNLDLGPEPRAGHIARLATIANEIKPGSYRPAKLAALASDPEALVDELSRFILAAGGEVPDEPIDAEAVEEVEGEVMEPAPAG